MLKIKYNKLYEDESYKNMLISIEPENFETLSVMQEMLKENFIVENPCKTFARLMKNGDLERYSDQLIEEYANCVNLLAEAWSDKPYENIMMIAVGLAQIIITQNSDNYKCSDFKINGTSKIISTACDDSS